MLSFDLLIWLLETEFRGYPSKTGSAGLLVLV